MTLAVVRVCVYAGLLLGLFALPGGAAASELQPTRFVVVLAGNVGPNGFTGAATQADAAALVTAAGGRIAIDLTRQIGVLIVDSAEADFDTKLRASSFVAEAGPDFKWRGAAEPTAAAEAVPGGGPEPGTDPLEPLQWSTRQIRAPQARAIQAGSRLVEVGILDTGVQGNHRDFADLDGSNVDCAKGRDFVPVGPGVGNPDPCTPNNFHGTWVAGFVGARVNGIGIVGVAPNVTIVPIKVCDSFGFCYASASAAGITYAGDARLEVANMSYTVDDDSPFQGTEFKCMNDPAQRAFRRANERAVQYARSRGVLPVAALGNSDQDLAHPPEPYENNCDVVPAETAGVIGVGGTGPTSGKALTSSYGIGATDVVAPAGDPPFGNCANAMLSTFPPQFWFCLNGTSGAAPHVSGVAALIITQFGRIDERTGDVEMPPSQVESFLQATTVDLGKPGYDECFGHGRVDALRAVLHDTSHVYDATAPHCPEYNE